MQNSPPLFDLSEALQGWAIGLAVVVWIAALVFTFRRSRKNGLWIRAGAVTLAVVALLLLILQPMRSVPTSPSQLLVLTENADAKVADSLKKVYPGIVEMQWPEQDITVKLKDAAISTVHIVGDGLSPSQLEQLTNKDLQFYLNDLPQGLFSLQFNKSLKVGDTLTIKGQVRLKDSSVYGLQLVGPEGTVEVLAPEEEGIHTFAQSSIAKRAGDYLYHLVEMRGEQTDTLGSVPVRIRPKERIRVFILNHAPSFETKYIKNWLADAGYPVAVRSTISRGQYISEFHNMEERSLRNLSFSLFSQFDLVVLPVAAFRELSASDRQELLRATRDGLGVLSMSTPTNRSLPPTLRPFVPGLQPAPTATSATIAIEKDLVELSTTPFTFVQDLSLFPVIRDDKGQLLAAYALKNKGKIGFMRLADTYRLVLDGFQSAYSQIWKSVLEEVSRRQTLEEFWTHEPGLLNAPDAPLTIKRYGNVVPENIGVKGAIDSLPLAPMQHPFHTELHRYTFWPTENGWIEVYANAEERPTHQAFVAAQKDWAVWKRSEVISFNQEWKAAVKSSAEKVQAAPVYQSVPVPAWVFYIMLIIALSVLWLEEKL